MITASSADGGLLSERDAQEIERLRLVAVEAVRAARSAWSYLRGWHGPDFDGAGDVCALLFRCAAELGDALDNTTARKSATNERLLALRAWLAVDAWRRAKAAV